MCITGVLLIALQLPMGWVAFGIGVALLVLSSDTFRRDIALIYLSLALLGITRIDTTVTYAHMGSMGLTLLLAVALPYFVSRYIYKDYLVRFRWHHGRSWYKKEVFYVFFTVVVSYFLLPFYLRDTGAYLNWSVEPGFSFLSRLFVGTNALGIWDELFFISTVLGILRRFLPFGQANFVQSVLFTSFLFELGFTGWGPIAIFLFALLQGYVFRKTESLLYVVTIHLSLDFVLYLALIQAHYPSWIPIFIT
jgi:membrane protease YdiL (CAAX protease family)